MPDTGPIHAEAILALGRKLTPVMAKATFDMYRRLFSDGYMSGLKTESFSYGAHVRHKLTIFRNGSQVLQPIFLFVAGGGLVAPFMAETNSPFISNVGVWAARNGMLGVTMTNRLAPEAKWPAGAEDVAAALQWLQANGPTFGGDPAQIILMGHSAGAGHVAAYCANRQLHGEGVQAAKAIILLSGPYNILSLPGGPNQAYYGNDPTLYPACNAIPGLIRYGRPILIGAAENDPPEFELQALELMNAWHRAYARLPDFIQLAGHNHISVAAHIGACDSALTRRLTGFLKRARNPCAP